MSEKYVVTLEQDGSNPDLDELNEKVGYAGFKVTHVQTVECDHEIRQGQVRGHDGTIELKMWCSDCGETFEVDFSQEFLISDHDDFVEFLEESEPDEDDHTISDLSDGLSDDEDGFFPANPVGDQ